MARPIVNLYRLGRLPYVKGLNVQQVLFDRIKARVITQIDNKRGLDRCRVNDSEQQDIFTQDNSLVLVEHEPVYTIGLRKSQYNDVYEKKLLTELEEHNLHADLFRTNRGGLITFHGPGQLVAYPILYLGDFGHTIKNKSLKAYVSSLEATIIDTLARVGLDGAHTIQEYPGVWFDGGQRKIAFVGISCKRYVTMHGISINCNCDLRWFDHIVSCGIEDKAITSIHREMLSKPNQFKNHERHSPVHGGRSLSSNLNHYHHQQQQPSKPPKCVDVGHVSKLFCESFTQIFDCSLLEKQKHELDHEIAKLIS